MGKTQAWWLRNTLNRRSKFKSLKPQGEHCCCRNGTEDCSPSFLRPVSYSSERLRTSSLCRNHGSVVPGCRTWCASHAATVLLSFDPFPTATRVQVLGQPPIVTKSVSHGISTQHLTYAFQKSVPSLFTGVIQSSRNTRDLSRRLPGLLYSRGLSWRPPDLIISSSRSRCSSRTRWTSSCCRHGTWRR